MFQNSNSCPQMRIDPTAPTTCLPIALWSLAFSLKNKTTPKIPHRSHICSLDLPLSGFVNTDTSHNPHGCSYRLHSKYHPQKTSPFIFNTCYFILNFIFISAIEHSNWALVLPITLGEQKTFLVWLSWEAFFLTTRLNSSRISICNLPLHIHSMFLWRLHLKFHRVWFKIYIFSELLE